MTDNTQTATAADSLSLAMPGESTNLPAVIETEVEKQGLVETKDFTDEMNNLMAKIVDQTNIRDTNTTLMFASKPQKDISSFLDTLLEDVKAGDVGFAGDITLELARSIDLLKIEQVRQELQGNGTLPSFLSFLNKWFGATRYFLARQEDVVKLFADITLKAKERQVNLAKQNAKLDMLVKQTAVQIKTLEVFIAAGEKVLLDAKDEFLRLREEMIAKGTNNPVETSELNDFYQQIISFDVRLVKVKLAYVQSAVSIPQIRIAQQATKIEMQNIEESILFNLPTIKVAIVNVASSLDTRKAQSASAAQSDAAMKIANLSADMLDETFIESKKSQGSVLDQVNALADVSGKLIETMRKGVEIDKENAAKRNEAANKLIEVKTQMEQEILALETENNTHI